MTSISDRITLDDYCDQINATWGMRQLLRQIYDLAGYSHALATLRGWGWTP
jgi:hypothetical protein